MEIQPFYYRVPKLWPKQLSNSRSSRTNAPSARDSRLHVDLAISSSLEFDHCLYYLDDCLFLVILLRRSAAIAR